MHKIIHIDMDCFYAAVEMRDDPSLRGKPVAVGGSVEERGVLCTCNYEARKFGLHAALSTAKALRLCPDVILLPVDMPKYVRISKRIRKIFKQYTQLIEPLSLDEAFLDVTDCKQFKGSATLIAQAIRKQIYQEHQLTASAGVAPNKFLAKVASDWEKPNGQFVITPNMIEKFMKDLPANKIFGVGKVTANKLLQIGIRTCVDLQKLNIEDLIHHFGNFGVQLYELCRGIDHRPVEASSVRKSLSVEETYANDLQTKKICLSKLPDLFERLIERLNRKRGLKPYKQFIKIKFNDFAQTTVEALMEENIVSLHQYEKLFLEGYARHQRSVRLLGLGVRFKESEGIREQLNLLE